jgi:hypothetical protein
LNDVEGNRVAREDNIDIFLLRNVSLVIINNLNYKVENNFLDKLKAEEVKVAPNNPALNFLVFELANLQFLQGMLCLEVN